ncbi:MAG: hypothetical protein GF411_15880 [Candidatus Lokiarchaeota archaeon]|nr:hypothetical protein [Candidatus Lokiarchaeota archaeon]
MRKLENRRYRQIRETELTEIINSLYLHDLFSGEKGLHKGYGGLLISSAIKRILQPKVISGVRLSWGQIIATDGETLSGEIDLMACTNTPLRHWDVINYTIERIEYTKAIFEVKHSFPSKKQIETWSEGVHPILALEDTPVLGIITLWDESIKEDTDFDRRERKLVDMISKCNHCEKQAFILSGGGYETDKRIINLESWDKLANLIEIITPPAYFS